LKNCTSAFATETNETHNSRNAINKFGNISIEEITVIYCKVSKVVIEFSASILRNKCLFMSITSHGSHLIVSYLVSLGQSLNFYEHFAVHLHLDYK
jgi:hypothetical protein